MSAPTKPTSRATSRAATKATSKAPKKAAARAADAAAPGAPRAKATQGKRVSAAAKAPSTVNAPAAAKTPPATDAAKAKAAAARAAARAAAKATREQERAEEARLAEEIRLAEEALASEQAKGRGLGTKRQWMVGGVLAVLAFQVFHAAEHVAQATYWLFNPSAPAWMSAWAMSGVNLMSGASGGNAAIGMELLHLVGNGIFLAGLLLAARLPEQYRTLTALKWLRLAMIVQALHFAEHVLLTGSVVFFGQAAGVSTLFGLLSAGSPAATGYRVFFHLTFNIVATVFALKAALAVRAAASPPAGPPPGTPAGTSSTRGRFDRVGAVVLALPLIGLLFLLPIFDSHAGHVASAEPSGIAATVNGEDITNADLEEAMVIARRLPTSPQLGVVGGDPDAEVPDAQLRVTMLNRLVQNTLIEQGAAELGVTIEDWEVQARQAELIETDFFGREAFDQFLADNNVTEDYATDQVRGLLLQEKVHGILTRDAVFTQDEIESVYAEQYDGFPRGQHLVTDSEANAIQYLARAESGENFSEMIRRESTDPRAAGTAGLLGPIREAAQVPEMVDAVTAMQDGEFAVVQTQYGWHVLQRIAPATLPEVQDEIRTNLLLVRQANAGQEWLGQLRDAAQVTLAAGSGAWNIEFGAVVAES